MDLPHLKTFVTIAREGSITRASERLHLSQPAVSAHVKALEDELGLALFERTARGMALTREGQRLLAKAEQTLLVHRELLDEATRLKGRASGRLRVGASNANHDAIGRLVGGLAEHHPDVEVALRHMSSNEVIAGLRAGTLDAGFFNAPTPPPPELATIEVARFTIHVAAPPGFAEAGDADWAKLAATTWIFPPESACCARAAAELFTAHRFEPPRVVSVDREDLTRTLVASGIGVGLLHRPTAEAARARGEVVLLHECPSPVAVLFAWAAARVGDPLIDAAASALAPT